MDGYIFDFCATAENNSTKLDRKQKLTSSTTFVIAGLIRKTRRPPWPQVGWVAFAELLLHAKQRLTYLIGWKISMSSTKFVFFSGGRKTKIAVLASNWQRHFRLVLYNHCTEFNETCQESSTQRPPKRKLCFSGRSEYQDGCIVHCLAETFSSSSLQQLNRIQRNLTKNKISMPSARVVFLGKKIKMIASNGLRYFRRLLCNCWPEFNETWQKAILNILYQVCVFRPIGKLGWPP